MAFTYDFTRKGDICWTTTPYSEKALSEMPCVEMIGYQQQWSTTLISINTWFTRFKNIGNGGNPYKNLYMGIPQPSSTYRLPFFNEYHHNTSQSWQENNGPVGEWTKKLTDLAETAAKMVLPAAGILYPKSYAGAGPTTYSFTFNLINTNAGNGTPADISHNISRNKQFIEQFIRDNLHDQNGMLSIIPPLIYEVFIPGVRWSPAAVVSNFVVSNKGSLNRNTNGIIHGAKPNYIYPDAWEITIGITELINESRKIWDDARAGTTIDGVQTRVFPAALPAADQAEANTLQQEEIQRQQEALIGT